MRADRISIIVPCYNAERTLAATLDSALGQEGVEVEAIVVDDGSTDGSPALARSYEPRIKLITGPNRGASAARNTGIAAASARWIVFLDADDLLEPGTLAKRLDRANATGADVIVTDWVEIIDDGSGRLTEGAHRGVDWRALDRNAEIAIAGGVWATTAAILYARGIVDKIGGFRADLPIIQDARYFFDAAHTGARFAQAEHVGARYRILAGSLSRRNPARFSLDLLTNAKTIAELWQASGGLDDDRRRVLLGMLNNAGRGLLQVAHSGYFEAVEAQGRLGLPLPMHSRIAPPIARVIGLARTRALLSLVGRE